VFNFLFGFNGRVRRSSYFLGAIGAMLLWSVLCMVLFGGFLFANSAQFDWSGHGVILAGEPEDLQGGPVLGVLFLILAILGLWASLALTVKRWHDVGMTGWFALLTLPPFANFVVFLLLCLLPGTVGPNRHGKDPRGRSAPAAYGEQALA
jgi:uncharacterized membrane protein YhaH (DUF805 family)